MLDRINVYEILLDITLISTFVIPISLLEQMSLPVDKYIFCMFMIIIYALAVAKCKIISFLELMVILLTVLFILIKEDISYIHLISIALGYRIVSKKEDVERIRKHLQRTPVIYVCLVSVLFYSCIFFGTQGRYLFTGNLDPNTNGLAIFSLGVILSSRNKILSNVVFALGILTLSRLYLLSLIIYCLYNLILANKKGFIFNYAWMSFIGIIALILLGYGFIALSKDGMLSVYQLGFSRLTNILDYSNYFRFVTNINLFGIYNENLNLLFSGMSNEDFFYYNTSYSVNHGLLYRAIKPHSYFFSYLQIYGIWCLVIFYTTYNIFKKLIDKRNNGIAFIILLYLLFLSLGAANYWLFISIAVLIVSSDIPKKIDK